VCHLFYWHTHGDIRGQLHYNKYMRFLIRLGKQVSIEAQKFLILFSLMPNWCRNRVDVYSENKTDLQKVLDIFNNKNVFEQIIPEPNWSKIPFKGELPKKREMKAPNGEVVMTVTEFSDGTQDTRWYDWRLENWDTKWDVHDAEIEEERWENDLESFTAEFQTAWSPPEAICRRLRALFPNVSISWFYDEPGCQFAGYL